MKRICVFCGSSPGRAPGPQAAARLVGARLAARGLGVVYGGASVGLMTAVADAAKAAGAEVIGVVPKMLMRKEVAHAGLDDLRVVETMHERKALMAELSDGFIALPGGIGTFEELFEIWTWAQLGAHRDPVGLLNVDGFYDTLLTFLDSVVDAGFLRPSHRDLLLVDDDVDRLLDRMATFTPSTSPPWIDADHT